MSKLNAFFGIGGFAVGLVGIGQAIGSHSKLNDICRRLDMTMDTDQNEYMIKLAEHFVKYGQGFKANALIDVLFP